MTANQITQRAFNAGYLVEKHLPQLSKLLVKGFKGSEHPYVKGFVAGSSEMVKERGQNKSKFLEKLKAEFGAERKTKGKSRDDKEMEIDI